MVIYTNYDIEEWKKMAACVCFQVYRPTGITTGYHSFKHNHNNDKRKRDQKRYYNQAKASRPAGEAVHVPLNCTKCMH